MSDIAALNRRLKEPFFSAWDGHVPREHVEAATRAMRTLIDAMLAQGAAPTEQGIRAAVEECVRRLNDLDNGWITTIEREDLCETIYQLVDLAGFEADEDWVEERDW